MEKLLLYCLLCLFLHPGFSRQVGILVLHSFNLLFMFFILPRTNVGRKNCA